jgi:hypothetical protein
MTMQPSTLISLGDDEQAIDALPSKTRQGLERDLSGDAFLNELHHLFWLAPHVNHGKRDDGWNCRDHALVFAAVAQLRGARASAVSGIVMFVQGSTEGTRPVGRRVEPHAWVIVESVGTFDVSVRLAHFKDLPEWKDWQVSGLLGSAFHPRNRVSYMMTADEVAFETCVNAATHQEDGRFAFYLRKRVEPLTADMIKRSYSWCNSPLTDRLRNISKGRRDLYAKAILHLSELVDGSGDSVTKLAQMKAWKRIAERPGNAIEEVCGRCALG